MVSQGMMGIRRTIRSTVIPGAVKVATMLTFPSGHVIEANGDELMRWLMGRLRGNWEIAGWSAGVATLVRLLNEKGQSITSILGSLRGIMFQSSSPNTIRLHHFIRKLTHNATAGSAPGARLDGVRPIRVSHAGGRCEIRDSVIPGWLYLDNTLFICVASKCYCRRCKANKQHKSLRRSFGQKSVEVHVLK